MENDKLTMPTLGLNAPQPVDHCRNLVSLVKQLVKEGEYDGVALLFTSSSEASKNLSCLPKIAIELYHHVCLKHLTQNIYDSDPELYSCAEELLKTLAASAPAEELLLELLELIEEAKSEQVYTSALRALQVVLLRHGNLKPRALEWSLNSIIQRRDALSVPSFLEEDYDKEQQALLEQGEPIQNLVMFYITLGLFYDPLVANICTLSKRERGQYFRICAIDSRNVMCCFLLDLLGKPLALLDLSNSEDKKTNTYSLQCARSLTKGITKCLVDPFFLLDFVETKVRWKPRLNDAETIHKRSICNIFLIDDKLSLDCLAIYYYMIISEGVEASRVPLVYHPLYVMEKSLYLAQELLSNNQPAALHHKALKLVSKLLSNLGKTWKIPSSNLDLEIHRTFCNTLCNIVSYSSCLYSRQLGVNTLKQYILAFDHEGKYLVLINLMRTVQHQGLCGYLATIYKDLVAEALKTSKPLVKPFSGADFQTIFLQNICHLKQGVETDLIDNADQIISSLNAIRFFAIKDAENRTGFWSFIGKLEQQFVEPLRKALNLSEAHYKAELHNVREGRDMSSMQNLNILDIAIGNDNMRGNEGLDLQLDRDKKIELLNQNLCTFDLIRSLLGRVCEFLNQMTHKIQGTSENSAKAQGSIHDSSHLTQLACRTLASSAAAYSQDSSQHVYAEVTLNCSTKHVRHKTFLGVYSTRRSGLAQRRFCSVKLTAKDETIDEFRAREEKREKEYEQQERAEREEKEESERNAKVEAIREKILEAALTHVPTLGWTRNAIVQGAEEAGYSSVAHGMFPEGGYSLVSYFNGKCNEQLLKAMQKDTDNGTKEISNPLEFLVRFVRMRLEFIIPYKGQWAQALALVALPQNAPTALAQVLTVVDDICYYSGDRSVDVGWYTRRIGLATIFKMTELYMLQDTSPDHSKTWEFLQNRMDEAVHLQMFLQSTEDVTSKFHRSFNSAFVTARNILGLNYNRP